MWSNDTHITPTLGGFCWWRWNLLAIFGNHTFGYAMLCVCRAYWNLCMCFILGSGLTNVRFSGEKLTCFVKYFSWVVATHFFFQPYLGKWSNLIHIFRMGWFNHQLVFSISWMSPREDLTYGWNPPGALAVIFRAKSTALIFPEVFTSILTFGVLYTVTWMNRDL